MILEKLWSKLVPGGILVLDDYGVIEGETRAVDEFFQTADVSIEKLPYYNIPAFVVKGEFNA